MHRPLRRHRAGHARRLLRRPDRHGRVAHDRDRHGVPAAALRDRASRRRSATGSTPTPCSGYSCPGIVTLVIIISVFSWYYPARIVRAQVLSLREKEFVEAARMVGGSNFRIMRSHLLPHLVGTIIVYGTLTVATNILFEAALSYLGVGLPPPNASWGNLLSDAVTYYTVQPWLIVWPGLAILITTLVVQPARRRHARRDRPALDAVDRAPLTSRPHRRLSGRSKGIVRASCVRGPRNPTRGVHMRRPGLWLAVGALTVGVVLLGAAGCGNSSSSGSGGSSSAPGGQSVVAARQRRHAQDGCARRHRLHRSRAGLLPDVVAGRVRHVREASELPRQVG